MRVALYYVPQPDDPLYLAASAWLGRDAYSGKPLDRPAVAGLDGLDLDELTGDPRHYGFHATLKAPFELAEGKTAEDLVAAVAACCRTQPAFEVELQVAAPSQFLAFTLAQPSPGMQALHEDCVRLFDDFRAPLTDFDYNRRRRPNMTPAQEDQLRTFGYAGIFADFRFHMTLTGRIADADRRAQVLAALQQHFAPVAGRHVVSGLGVFMQPDRESDFTVLSWSRFEG